MSTWFVFLIPVSILASVFLFGFVGCGEPFTSGDPFGGGDGRPQSPYADLVKAGTPIGYWRLNDGEDTTTAWDEIGVDAAHPKGIHPGTYQPQPGNPPTPLPAAPDSAAAPGTLTFAQDGLLPSDPAKCVFFDGGYVEVTHDGALNPQQQFTLEAWVDPVLAQDDNFHRVVVGSYDLGPPALGYVLLKNTDNYFEIRIGLGTNGIGAVVGDPNYLAKDETYHLVATYDGTTLKLYVDGTISSQQDFAGYAHAGSIPIDIGVGQPTSADKLYPFSGRIQDVALYDQPLDANTIQQHYLQGIT